MLHKNDLFCTKDEIVLRTEDEGAFLFDPDTGRICYLNDTGINIWKFCAKPVTQTQVIKKICANHPKVEQTQVSSDCVKFLNDLMKLGFLFITEQ